MATLQTLPAPPQVHRRFGHAWVALAISIALHVVDEATFGFLSVYNPAVERIREAAPWLPLPTFSFGWWIAGLSTAVLLLLLLAPLAYRGIHWITIAARILAVLMVLNALAHVTISVYQGHPMPGVYSSPILLTAALALFLTAHRT